MCLGVTSEDSFCGKWFPNRGEKSVSDTATGILNHPHNWASYHRMFTEASSVICLSVFCANCVEIDNRLIMDRKLGLLLCV